MDSAVKARMVTQAEALAFENSVDGLAWKFWQGLKADHPEINSIEAAKALIIEAGPDGFEYIARSTELASGESDLKKSTGQAEEASEAALAGQ